MIEQPTQRPLLHKVDAVAAMLQISRTAVYAAIQRGQLKTIKLGRSTRIPQDEVARVVREGLAGGSR
jgi:excisionase family DNA binding protein